MPILYDDVLPLLDVREGPDIRGEVKAICPAHEDHEPSLWLRKGDDGHKAAFVCRAGCEQREIIAALRTLGLGTRTMRRSPGKTKPRAQTRPETGEAPSGRVFVGKELDYGSNPDDWHAELMAQGSGNAHYRYLTEQRGLSAETLEQFRIGTNGFHITVPVFADGKLRNVRKSLPGAAQGKKWKGIEEHNTPVLFPSELLAEATVPVLLCEGEYDALLANQQSDGGYIALTGTGGAGNLPKDLARLKGREVFVAYDCDVHGIEGAAKVDLALAEIGATAHILDLTRLGLPADSKEDMSDFFLRYGGTAKRLLEEMETLREDVDFGKDEVLREIEQMFLVADDSARDHLAYGLTDEQIAALDPPRFVVDGWLPCGFFSVLYGAPGVMKTFAILDIARHVRSGLPWHSHPVERGAVLLYEGEGLQQVQARIAAWDSRYPTADLAPGWSFQRFVDLTQPEGVAAIVRTVRGYEAQTGVPVRLIAIDPLVEFMTGDENGEGTQQASRGLRALAQYLNTAVLVGHHSNALGERARGTDHLKMRAGAHIRMERTSDEGVALVQEKQKNAAPLATVLYPKPVLGSLVLDTGWTVPAANYAAHKANEANASRAEAGLEKSRLSHAIKADQARRLLLDAVLAQPGLTKGALLGAVKSQGIGNDLLDGARQALLAEGALRVEDGPNRSHLHYPGDG